MAITVTSSGGNSIVAAVNGGTSVSLSQSLQSVSVSTNQSVPVVVANTLGPQGVKGAAGTNGADGADGVDLTTELNAEIAQRGLGDALNQSAIAAVSGQLGLLRSTLNTGTTGDDLSDIGTPASDDKVLIQDKSDSNNLKYVDFGDFATGVGDITSVVAGTGLTDGGTSGDVTLNVAGGTGITANANDISITDGGVGTTQLADDSVTEDKLDNTLLAEIDANTAKATNVSTDLAITGTTGARTITSSDGTDAVIPVATDSVSGVMSSTDHTKLSGIETGATADQTKSDINALAITTVGTVSSGIWNGTAIASAYLDSDTAHLSGTQTFSGAKTFSDSIQVDNINLDANTVSTTNTNGNLLLAANGTGFVELKGNTNAGAIRFNCEDNSHGVTIKGPAHSAGATYTLVLPTSTGTNGQALTTNGSGTLSFSDVSSGTSFDYARAIMSASVLKDGGSAQDFDSATPQKVKFDTSADTEGTGITIDTTNNRITVGSTGYYQLTANLSFYSAGARTTPATIFKKNGSTDLLGEGYGYIRAASVQNNNNNLISCIVELQANDYVEVFVGDTSTVSSSVFATQAFFEVSSAGGAAGPTGAQGPSGTTYDVVTLTGSTTLSSAHTTKYLVVDSASDCNLTVPATASYDANAEVVIEQRGAGAVTVVAASGVTINTSETLVSGGQYAVMGLKRTASNVYTLTGERQAS